MRGRPKLQLVLKWMVLVVKHEHTLTNSARTGESGTFLLGLLGGTSHPSCRITSFSPWLLVAHWLFALLRHLLLGEICVYSV